MIKLLLKIGIVYAILQYGFKVDINGYLKPYIEPLWQDAQQQLPDSAQELFSQAKENLPELMDKAEALKESADDNALTKYMKDRANAVNDAKTSVKELEKKMKEMQEAANKAAEGGN